MIGVVADETDYDIVREFFELFKTPWEFYVSGRPYEVILAPARLAPSLDVPIRILFGSALVPGIDDGIEAEVHSGCSLDHGAGPLPLYGSCLTFDTTDPVALAHNEGDVVAIRSEGERGTTVRLGYDLIDELRFLLVRGQPEAHAQRPAFEQHISILRDAIVAAGVPVAEIPPVPASHPFTVCLTHDVDHPLLKSHGWDHTALGFLFRASLGSVGRFFRGHLTLREVATNFLAAVRFPLVLLGVAKDPWADFDAYIQIERGLASTFFIIPRRGDPGRNVDCAGSEKRAASYDLEEIQDPLERIREAGGEIGLHGIDAWTDLGAAKSERDRVSACVDGKEIGVRMHWLCFDQDSPGILDAAGFSYDSTFGYNSTIGYRAGTLQVYRPLGAKDLLELPLHIMDTALFYPSYLNLPHREAADLVDRLVSDANRFGGVLTLNWHDRSIAPERQWGRFYSEVLEGFRQHAPWFATATDVTAWFRRRRAVNLEEVRRNGKVVSIRVRVDDVPDTNLPGMRLRVTQLTSRDAGNGAKATDCIDSEIQENAEITIAA